MISVGSPEALPYRRFQCLAAPGGLTVARVGGAPRVLVASFLVAGAVPGWSAGCECVLPADGGDDLDGPGQCADRPSRRRRPPRPSGEASEGSGGGGRQ